MNIKLLLGKRIKELRKQRKLTQENVSELIGIDTVSLSNIETGKYYPTAENLDKILNILKITPHELFDFEHLDSNDNLIQKINDMLNKNPERIKDVYKILKGFLG